MRPNQKSYKDRKPYGRKQGGSKFGYTAKQASYGGGAITPPKEKKPRSFQQRLRRFFGRGR